MLGSSPPASRCTPRTSWTWRSPASSGDIELSGELSAEDGREALADLAGLDIARYPHDPLLPRVWELRTSVTAYDAVYLALAELLEAPLLTLDRRLARARGHGARVEVP